MNIHEAVTLALKKGVQYIYRHDPEAAWDVRVDLGIDAPGWAVRYCGLGSDYEWHDKEDFVFTQDDFTTTNWRIDDLEAPDA